MSIDEVERKEKLVSKQWRSPSKILLVYRKNRVPPRDHDIRNNDRRKLNSTTYAFAKSDIMDFRPTYFSFAPLSSFFHSSHYIGQPVHRYSVSQLRQKSRIDVRAREKAISIELSAITGEKVQTWREV